MPTLRILLPKLLLSASAAALLVPCSPAQSSPQPQPLTPAQLLNQLDPDMAQVIELFNTIKGRPLTSLTPPDARQQFAAQDAAKFLARTKRLAEQPLPVAKVTDGVTIPGCFLNQITIVIYTPEGTGPFPVILYFHGGGFVVATIDTYDPSARGLSRMAGAVVVSVEYRKAPEAPYPAALNDAIDSYQWVTSQIGSYNGIPTKVAVAGESAGGNLATEVALAARDQNLQRPTHQLLIYPVTSSNVKQPSDIIYANAVPRSTPLLNYFFQNYADPSQANDPGVAPIDANLAGLPPTTIIAAEEDPLQSDGQAYAAKLLQAGNQVQYRIFTGTTHEFYGMYDVVRKARLAEQYGAERVAASFR